MNNGSGLFLIFFVVAIALWFVSFAWDKGRIANYIEERGGILLSSEWAPFGKGWFGEKSDRIYEISYCDAEGNERTAFCKTSLWTGVYLSDDRVTNPTRARSVIQHVYEQSRMEQLEAENKRLKEELTSFLP